MQQWVQPAVAYTARVMKAKWLLYRARMYMLVQQPISKKWVLPVDHCYATYFMHNATWGHELYHKWVVGHSQNVTLIPDALDHVLAYQVILAHHLQGETNMSA